MPARMHRDHGLVKRTGNTYLSCQRHTIGFDQPLRYLTFRAVDVIITQIEVTQITLGCEHGQVIITSVPALAYYRKQVGLFRQFLSDTSCPVWSSSEWAGEEQKVRPQSRKGQID